MHQSIPAVPIPPGIRGAFAHVVSQRSPVKLRFVNTLRDGVSFRKLTSLRLFLTIALRILSAHNLWRHLARPRARAY